MLDQLVQIVKTISKFNDDEILALLIVGLYLSFMCTFLCFFGLFFSLICLLSNAGQ